MKNSIKALVFDLDGTIADTIPAITEGINLTMEKLGFPAHTEDEVRTYINFGPRHLISEALPKEAKENDETLVDRALAIYNEMYAKTYIHTDRTYDRMEKVLSELGRQYKIAVLSNKQDEYVKLLAKQLIPAGVCLAAYGSLEGIPAKPAPTLALALAKELGVAPCECALIGDSQVDIKTARAAGFEIVSVSWGYVSKEKLLENGADTVLDTPDELLRFFDKR